MPARGDAAQLLAAHVVAAALALMQLASPAAALAPAFLARLSAAGVPAARDLCAWPAQSRARPRRGGGTWMQVGWSGGDLEGGRDDARNADVRALKKLFYEAREAVDAGAAASREDEVDAGLLRDIPLARFRMVVLPHQQVAFNIFQPQLVHMFESLLATPQPWLYLHVLLPGGVENLDNPLFALPGLGEQGAAGSETTLQGSLMQVVAAERQSDSRIALICQALSRAVVLKGTQALPYSRGDIQILPDVEQVRRSGSVQLAVAEEHCWRDYEFAPVHMGDVWEAQLPPWASFQPAALARCVQRTALEARRVHPGQGDAGMAAGGVWEDALSSEAVSAVLEEAEHDVQPAETGNEEGGEQGEEKTLEKRLALLEVETWLSLGLCSLP